MPPAHPGGRTKFKERNVVVKQLIENSWPWTCVVQAGRLGHAVLQTPDLDRQVDFYTGLVGFTEVSRGQDSAFLASRAGQLAVEMRRGDVANCIALSFEVAPDTNFVAVRNALSEHGIASEIRTDALPGLREVLAFRDPKGTEIILFRGWEQLVDCRRIHGVSPLKFGHIAFSVPDICGIVKFYKEILGFRESDWIEDFFVFMRCNADHHTLNFLKGHSGKMHHIAFELQDASHMRKNL